MRGKRNAELEDLLVARRADRTRVEDVERRLGSLESALSTVTEAAATGDRPPTDRLVMDVARALELLMLEVTELRRDVDALRQGPHPG
jgi:hypothetical protein